MRVPTPVESFVLRMKAFVAEHRYCKVETPSKPKET